MNGTAGDFVSYTGNFVYDNNVKEGHHTSGPDGTIHHAIIPGCPGVMFSRTQPLLFYSFSKGGNRGGKKALQFCSDAPYVMEPGDKLDDVAKYVFLVQSHCCGAVSAAPALSLSLSLTLSGQ